MIIGSDVEDDSTRKVYLDYVDVKDEQDGTSGWQWHNKYYYYYYCYYRLLTPKRTRKLKSSTIKLLIISKQNPAQPLTHSCHLSDLVRPGQTWSGLVAPGRTYLVVLSWSRTKPL